MDPALRDRAMLLAGGICPEAVHAFAKEGAKLALSSTRQEKLDRLIPALGVDEDHAKGFIVDATKEEEIKAFVEGAKEAFGTIDIVVVNAGYEGKVCPITAQSTEEFTKVYTLNVYSPMWLMKYAAPVLQEKKLGLDRAPVLRRSLYAYSDDAGLYQPEQDSRSASLRSSCLKASM